jgi:hypothetical protein
MSITGSSSIRPWEIARSKVDLHELSPVGGWPAGGRHGRRLERFAQVCQGLTSRGRSHPGLLPLANLRFEVSRLLPAVSSAPDVAAAGGARQWKLLPHPGHQLGPGNPRRVVRAGLLMRVAASFRGMTVAPMPAGHRLLALSDVPDRQRRDAPPELVVGCKHPVIPVPVLPRRRHEIGEPVEKLKRCELDDAAGPWPCGLSRAARADPADWNAFCADARKTPPQGERGARRDRLTTAETTDRADRAAHASSVSRRAVAEVPLTGLPFAAPLTDAPPSR